MEDSAYPAGLLLCKCIPDRAAVRPEAMFNNHVRSHCCSFMRPDTSRQPRNSQTFSVPHGRRTRLWPAQKCRCRCLASPVRAWIAANLDPCRWSMLPMTPVSGAVVACSVVPPRRIRQMAAFVEAALHFSYDSNHLKTKNTAARAAALWPARRSAACRQRALRRSANPLPSAAGSR